jgi:phosphoenolpyruvate synthase/pyruvate phosphate dikinase
MSLLAEKFIELTKGQEISPPLTNSAAFMQTSGWNGGKYFNPFYQDRLPNPAFLTMKNGEGLLYYCITKNREQGKEVLSKYLKDPFLLRKIQADFKQKAAAIDKLYSTYTPSIIDKTKEPELLKISKKITDLGWRMNGRLFFTIAQDEELIAHTVENLGRSISPARLREVLELSAESGANSFETHRKITLAKLKAQGKTWEALGELCQYFYAYYFKVLPVKEVSRKLRKDFSSFSSLQYCKKYLSEAVRKQNQKDKRLKGTLEKLPALEKKLVRFLVSTIELRDRRKDAISKVIAINYNIAAKVFRKSEVWENLIYFYTLPELYKGVLYLKKVSKRLEERQKGFSVLVKDSGELVFEYGKHNQNKLLLEKNQLAQFKANRYNKEIQGQIGCPGKARGRVCVIKNIQTDAVKFKTGNILVTGMTRPEFVPLMQKASAIITDEGGITSHAAIVSRELGIPCIIGTKIATKVLKDGDLVEVKANHGTVKIINN